MGVDEGVEQVGTSEAPPALTLEELQKLSGDSSLLEVGKVCGQPGHWILRLITACRTFEFACKECEASCPSWRWRERLHVQLFESKTAQRGA